MPDDSPGISFTSIDDTVKRVQQTLDNLKKVEDQLDKPRSVVCSVLNVTDLVLNFGGDSQDHGGLVEPLPPISIAPRSGASFGAQSSGGSILTGTEGRVFYNATDGTAFSFHWDNPWAGSNSSDSTVGGPLAPLYRTWTITGHGDQKAPMLFVAMQVMPTPFRDIWVRLGGATGLLRLPTGDWSPTPDGIGCFLHFDGGSIYSSPASGTREVHGAIFDKWAALGWEAGLLGYPVSDELGTPDGIGAFSHFQHGSIYWTPATGAHEVHGAIRDKWASVGWETSSLGYPTTDETDVPNRALRVNFFQHGAIVFDTTTGAVTLSQATTLGALEIELTIHDSHDKPRDHDHFHVPMNP